MKKVLIIVSLAFLFAFTCSAIGNDLIAEILPADIEVYYGETKLEVPAYSDGTTVYVPLETLMQTLGGSYEAQEEKVVISVVADMLPPMEAAEASVIVEVAPATSWEYLDYYYMNKWGCTLKEALASYGNGAEIIEKIDIAIEKQVDLDKLLDAIENETMPSGGLTKKLDKLIK